MPPVNVFFGETLLRSFGFASCNFMARAWATAVRPAHAALRETFHHARERKPKDFIQRDVEPIRYNGENGHR